MKTLLVLGATPFQLPIVKQAQQMGHFVITMDNVPENPAHRQADESALVSITDPEAVLAYAQQRKIDGIITGGSEIGMAALGRVCDEMGLAGVTHEQALLLTRKDQFRTFQQQHGLAQPQFYVFENWQEFTGVAAGLAGDFVLKPVDRSGSKGVAVLNLAPGKIGDEYCPDVSRALSQSLCGRVILEDFLDGAEHGGDGFLRDGKAISFFITNKSLTPAPYHVPTGHTIPSRLAVQTRQNIQAAVVEALALAGFRNGPFNFDVMVGAQEQEVTIIEIGPRFGGNGIPQIIAHGAGFDAIETSIVYALEGAVPEIKARNHEAVLATGSRILGCERAGILHYMTPVEAVRQKFAPDLIDLSYDFEVGDSVEKFTQGNYRVGQVIATAADLDTLDTLLNEIMAEINIQVR